MLNHTIGIARKYGAKVGAATGALVLSSAAMAQAGPSTTIVEKVEAAFSTGELIAGAVVLGLFAIFAIKLLWRSK